MEITKHTVDVTPEKKIIIGCIVSDKFMRDITQLVPDLSLLTVPHLRLVGGWCFRYFNKYKQAPKETIGDIFENEKGSLKPEQVEYIDNLLIHLNETYMDADFNADYFLNNAKKYIDERNIINLSERLKGMASKGDTERAYSEVSQFKKIENPMGMGIDVINDKSFVSKIFEDTSEDLFQIPGDLGRCIQAKYRGDVIGIGARQKLGKTWFLMKLGMWAALAGKNVCYYTLEMKGSIMGKRIFKSMAGAVDPGKEQEIIVPYYQHERSQGHRKCSIQYEYQKPKDLNLETCVREQRALRVHMKEGGFRLFDRASGGATMEQIEYSLENLEEYDNYIADVVIIDYDDIVEVEGPDGRDDRSRLNHVWLYAKKIASERNILVILASQNGRQTFKRDADVDDISGDIRKFSHVSHWITLNQTPEEKKSYLMRVKAEGRHGEFNSLDEVVCLQNLSIGNPVIDSKFKRDITNYAEWVEQMNVDIEGEY